MAARRNVRAGRLPSRGADGNRLPASGPAVGCAFGPWRAVRVRAEPFLVCVHYHPAKGRRTPGDLSANAGRCPTTGIEGSKATQPLADRLWTFEIGKSGLVSQNSEFRGQELRNRPDLWVTTPAPQRSE